MPAPTKPTKKRAKATGKPAAKPAAKPARNKAPAKPAFGRPGTAGKADGDAAVRAWMRGVKPEHREVVERLDRLIGKTVPGVQRAVKWSTPLYGLPGKGWIASVASFKEHVSLGFFAGARLDPPPPLGESKQMRRISLRGMEDFDEARFSSWLRQASRIPGWGRL